MPTLPEVEPRLARRYQHLVQEHMSSLESLACGLRALPAPGVQAFASTQAAWRFLANERVTLPTLAAPLLAASAAAAQERCTRFALVVHDWSVLNYERHTRKKQRVQVARRGQLGYDLATALLLSDQNGAPLGPLCQELRAEAGWYSSRAARPSQPEVTAHLDALAAPLAWIDALPLGRPVVQIIDREADSVGHYRTWAEAGHQFVVRADDRMVKVKDPAGQWVEKHLQAVVDELWAANPQGALVAETTVLLTRPANQEHRQADGTMCYQRVPGVPLPLRLIVSRQPGVAEGRPGPEWWLLTNVAETVDAATIVQWYRWRWEIESFFKLLKSSGQHLEHWLQQQPSALAKRLLVASMACVLVWQLARAQSAPAQAAAKLLVRLSGRQTKRAKPVTASAMLAGLWSLLGVLNALQDHSVEELRAVASLIFGKPV